MYTNNPIYNDELSLQNVHNSLASQAHAISNCEQECAFHGYQGFESISHSYPKSISHISQIPIYLRMRL